MNAIETIRRKYTSETYTIEGRQGTITVENRRPDLRVEERRRMLREVRAGLYEIFSRCEEAKT